MQGKRNSREKREREFNVGQVRSHNARDQSANGKSGQGRYNIEDLGIWVGKGGATSHENKSSNG